MPVAYWRVPAEHWFEHKEIKPRGLGLTGAHADLRHRQGIPAEAVVREYQVLREVLTTHLPDRAQARGARAHSGCCSTEPCVRMVLSHPSPERRARAGQQFHSPAGALARQHLMPLTRAGPSLRTRSPARQPRMCRQSACSAVSAATPEMSRPESEKRSQMRYLPAPRAESHVDVKVRSF